jgi:hypothetical protein
VFLKKKKNKYKKKWERKNNRKEGTYLSRVELFKFTVVMFPNIESSLVHWIHPHELSREQEEQSRKS